MGELEVRRVHPVVPTRTPAVGRPPGRSALMLQTRIALPPLCGWFPWALRRGFPWAPAAPLGEMCSSDVAGDFVQGALCDPRARGRPECLVALVAFRELPASEIPALAVGHARRRRAVCAAKGTLRACPVGGDRVLEGERLFGEPLHPNATQWAPARTVQRRAARYLAHPPSLSSSTQPPKCQQAHAHPQECQQAHAQPPKCQQAHPPRAECQQAHQRRRECRDARWGVRGATEPCAGIVGGARGTTTWMRIA